MIKQYSRWYYIAGRTLEENFSEGCRCWSNPRLVCAYCLEKAKLKESYEAYFIGCRKKKQHNIMKKSLK